ncbi:hypothetical protein HSX37_18070|uniref:Methyltransferase domain-containing protein n=1 Tax=Dendrosporobacter quercicolus TaxID=146817 RepID=A0A1G9X7W4_9FIRM|nr:hypothetical protein [Dendrosporobacter quercicolus]NSL49927.1 hypothetical protein [Dendrosporobacter quercicolus DSM 1736]SDM92611.1 hypothetical protein SAMN04488502_1099 [Dendrosporobacter quercicolus]
MQLTMSCYSTFLHHIDPNQILTEAYRILRAGGRAGLIHWTYDPKTPRGPGMDIRPKPEEMINWALQAGFQLEKEEVIDLPPYHYGFVAYKR